jgi:hypothetical protein
MAATLVLSHLDHIFCLMIAKSIVHQKLRVTAVDFENTQ